MSNLRISDGQLHIPCDLDGMNVKKGLALAFERLREEGLSRGNHYEISFAIEKPADAARAESVLIQDDYWIDAVEPNALQFGRTVKFVEKHYFEIIGRLADRSIRSIKSKLLSISIYSPELYHAQAH